MRLRLSRLALCHFIRPRPWRHCIPIDPFYLTYKARQYGYETRFIELAGEINNQMPAYKRWIEGALMIMVFLNWKKQIFIVRAVLQARCG